MKPPLSKMPSLGFVAICATYVLVIAFFLWGLSTPDLDRVWTLHHELKIGRIGRLKEPDREMLLRAIERHPPLGAAMLADRDAERGIGVISAHSEGWIATPDVTVLRTANAKEHRILVVDVQTPEQLMPFSIAFGGTGWKKTISVKGRGPKRVALPQAPEVAEIVTIRLKGRGLRADPSLLSTRLSFERGK